MDGCNMNNKYDFIMNDKNDKFDSQMLKTDYEGNFEKNLKNEVMKTLVVEILGKVGSMKEMMKEQFETLNNRIRNLEEELGKTGWKKFCEGEDFRDVTLDCDGKRNQAHRFIIPFIGLYSNKCTFKTFSSMQNRWVVILSNVSTAPMTSSLRIPSICDGVKNVITDSWRHVLSRVM